MATATFQSSRDLASKLLSDLAIHGYLDSDAAVADRLRSTIGDTCQTAGKRPHVILVHDESSFDIRAGARA